MSPFIVVNPRPPKWAPYGSGVNEITIKEESIDSSGALSVVYAATDELIRRYGGQGDEHLTFDDLRSPNGFFLVARIEGHLVGGVGVRSISEPSQHVGEVKRLWVRPDLRRGGIAKSLMNEIEIHAKQKGYARLFLETGPAQPEAIAFYEATGWLSVSEFPPDAFSHPIASRFVKDL
jgi:putative acetyltransferase